MTVMSDRGRILYCIGAAACGALAGYFGHRFIDGNEGARDIIVTVFSILAGFLIAVMTLLGDQSILPGSWRISETRRAAIKNKLIRQKSLFYLYLLTFQRYLSAA